MPYSQVSHAPYEIRQYPDRAVMPTILYLHVGESIPAAAVITPGGWKIIVFGTQDDITIVDDEDAARDYLAAMGQAAAA